MAQGRIARLWIRLEQVGRYQANWAGPARKRTQSRNQVFKKKSWYTLWLNTLIIKIKRVKLRKEE